ncbi:succinate dehydrogenase/fumarate reductase, flavoprotein subunit [Lactococcus lactis subsp. lactis]|uniref:Succinate dehydrogenase/fumarate reductase, flavoprotein subunit n=1 Tax=Lactococcus lactis subsp. lactis TaxID=1360 RepID=A0A0B8QRM1_LACLL|nr:succinate dehydrogenase/fumarate reductase, flavoprotein subunit [Lactococcus lactis subsp. lactis]
MLRQFFQIALQTYRHRYRSHHRKYHLTRNNRKFYQINQPQLILHKNRQFRQVIHRHRKCKFQRYKDQHQPSHRHQQKNIRQVLLQNLILQVYQRQYRHKLQYFLSYLHIQFLLMAFFHSPIRCKEPYNLALQAQLID